MKGRPATSSNAFGIRSVSGCILARIASPDLDRQLDQAIAQLGKVQAALGQAAAQVTLAEANLKLGNLTFARRMIS